MKRHPHRIVQLFLATRALIEVIRPIIRNHKGASLPFFYSSDFIVRVIRCGRWQRDLTPSLRRLTDAANAEWKVRQEAEKIRRTVGVSRTSDAITSSLPKRPAGKEEA